MIPKLVVVFKKIELLELEHEHPVYLLETEILQQQRLTQQLTQFSAFLFNVLLTKLKC